ncbi:VOC family protein [Virgibacillus kekensis]|uniref:VOC family protein n=1 Tax=Virgibacillus kekensis TaxID=202261 RepID=A0ABV9DNY7_9BACI
MAEKVKSLIDGIHYFRVPVVEVESSVDWYRDVLGLTLQHQEDELAVFHVNDGLLLVLVEADAESHAHFTRNGELEFSIGFTSSKLNELREHLISQGVNVEEMKEDNGHHFFHFYDPSGNKLQVHW